MKGIQDNQDIGVAESRNESMSYVLGDNPSESLVNITNSKNDISSPPGPSNTKGDVFSQKLDDDITPLISFEDEEKNDEQNPSKPPLKSFLSDQFKTALSSNVKNTWDVGNDPWDEGNPKESSYGKSEQNIVFPNSTDKVDAWDVEDDAWENDQTREVDDNPWKSEQSLESAAVNNTPSLKPNPDPNQDDESWDLEDDAWLSSQNVQHQQIEVLHESILKSHKNEKPEFVEQTTEGRVIIDESDAWDLDGDPWASSEPQKSSDYPPFASDSKSDNWKDGWDSVDEDLKASTTTNPTETSSHELTTAATALVKTVGGGLASFVESFKLSNLSSTLAAFEEKRASTEESSCTVPQAQDPTSNASESEGFGSGWGNWDLSSLAKSLTSTVENTVSF